MDSTSDVQPAACGADVGTGAGTGERYAVGVGANRGDRHATIAEAARRIGLTAQARLCAASALIESAPVGGPSGQDPFLNGAWIIETRLGPHQLLHLLQAIETALGRSREVRWGARTIDLDLLLRDDGLVVSTPVLTLPHPRLLERPFVLGPLAEIAGNWTHPLAHQTLSDLALRRPSPSPSPTTNDGRRTTDVP